MLPVRQLAERVLEIYWHQVLPFEGAALKQSTQPTAAILRETVRLRTAASAGDQRVALAVARLRAPVAYDTAVTAIGLTLVRQPLHRLRVGSHARTDIPLRRLVAERRNLPRTISRPWRRD